MTDRIALTAAEISFLLAAVDPAARSAAPTLLALAPEELSDPVRAAGLASLTSRGLVGPAGDGLQLSAPVAAVAEALTRPTTIIQLGLVAVEPDHADGTVLFDTGAVRLLIAPRLNRCFEVTGLDPAHPVPDVIVHIVRSFLAQSRPGVASLRLEHGSGSEPIGHRLGTPAVVAAPGFGWMTVAAGPNDVWTYADASQPTARQGTEAEALARLTRVLHELLALPAESPVA